MSPRPCAKFWRTRGYGYISIQNAYPSRTAMAAFLWGPPAMELHRRYPEPIFFLPSDAFRTRTIWISTGPELRPIHADTLSWTINCKRTCPASGLWVTATGAVLLLTPHPTI